jgi:hypothetical protein
LSLFSEKLHKFTLQIKVALPFPWLHRVQKEFRQLSSLDLSGRIFRELLDELDSAADQLEAFHSGFDQVPML